MNKHKILWLQPDAFSTIKSTVQEQRRSKRRSWLACLGSGGKKQAAAVHPAAANASQTLFADNGKAKMEFIEHLMQLDPNVPRHLLDQLQSLIAGFNSVNIVYGLTGIIAGRLMLGTRGTPGFY
jgi:hypothetical protein